MSAGVKSAWEINTIELVGKDTGMQPNLKEVLPAVSSATSAQSLAVLQASVALRSLHEQLWRHILGLFHFLWGYAFLPFDFWNCVNKQNDKKNCMKTGNWGKVW